MKKLVLILSMALLLGSIRASGASYGKCGESLNWMLSNKGVLTITGSGAMKDYKSDGQVPWRQSLVLEVSLPDGLTHIGANAFKGANIFAIEIPASVQSIGKASFARCQRLAAVELPYGLTLIDDDAFRSCYGLSKIQIPSSVRSIGNNAFCDCRSLSGISLPARMKALGQNAFTGCKALTDIRELPDYVTKTNCHEFGLAVSVVSRYFDRSKAGTAAESTEMVAKNQTKAAVPPVKPAKSVAEPIVADVPYGSADIDKTVPRNPQNNLHTFAFVIANENYARMPSVPFAINDGTSFANYCRYTLGLPEMNINLYKDASLGVMIEIMDYIKQLDEAFKGDLNILVYYAGHGAPDEKSSEAYIIPVDAHRVDPSVCYRLDDMYAVLGGLKASSVKVFLDACFSGAARTNDMLAEGGRGVVIAPQQSSVKGNVVVLSATSSDQTAWYFRQAGHGMFTYFLLKKLQETAGNVSMGELCDFVAERVSQMSIVVNRKSQTPKVVSSPSLKNRWRSWSVK